MALNVRYSSRFKLARIKIPPVRLRFAVRQGENIIK